VWTGSTILEYCAQPFPAPAHATGGLEFVPAPPGAPAPVTTTTSASAPVTISGTFRIVGGPPPGIDHPITGTIVATATSGRAYTAIAGADGRYSLRVPRGTYTIVGHSQQDQPGQCGGGAAQVFRDTAVDVQCDVP
jgi:hypothetical protein